MGSFSAQRTSGSILVNGQERKASQTFGYVPQHDILLNTATVRETFETAARLRIANISPDELKLRVDTVLVDMGLTHREDALVGGGEIRSLSGGEKRRVSIGQEIVSSQKAILMLDEPTTGLDSTTAESVMSCLRDLARKKNMIIIATIHQPNSNITSLFDDFMLMGKGECLYLGPFSDSVQKFSVAGFICPLYSNPTDFFISVAADEGNIATLAKYSQDWLKEQRNFVDNDAKQPDAAKRRTAGEGGGLMAECPTSTWVQFEVLVVRNAKQWYRDPGMLISELLQYIFLGLFLGGMYYDLDLDLETGVFGRTASLFFVLSILVFTPPMTAIVTFSVEKVLMEKETKDKMYTHFSWLLAKSIVLAPVEAVLCLVFSCIMYFMAGYQENADKFFIFCVILFVFQLIGESVGMFFAAISSSASFAAVYLTLFLVVVLSLSGFLTAEMPVFYEWIEDSNVLRFALLALIKNEFVGLEFTDQNGDKVGGLDSVPHTLRPDEDLSVGDYIAILVGYLFGIRLLIYLTLSWDHFMMSIRSHLPAAHDSLSDHRSTQCEPVEDVDARPSEIEIGARRPEVSL